MDITTENPVEIIPRRADLDRNTPTEHAVRYAMYSVERAVSHPLLTDANVLLREVLGKVADYVDLQATPESGQGETHEAV